MSYFSSEATQFYGPLTHSLVAQLRLHPFLVGGFPRAVNPGNSAVALFRLNQMPDQGSGLLPVISTGQARK